MNTARVMALLHCSFVPEKKRKKPHGHKSRRWGAPILKRLTDEMKTDHVAAALALMSLPVTQTFHPNNLVDQKQPPITSVPQQDVVWYHTKKLQGCRECVRARGIHLVTKCPSHNTLMRHALKK